MIKITNKQNQSCIASYQLLLCQTGCVDYVHKEWHSLAAQIFSEITGQPELLNICFNKEFAGILDQLH